MSGKSFFRHYRPCGAAGCRHKRLVLGHIAHEVLSLFDSAEVSADSYFYYAVETELFHSGGELFGRSLRAELTYKSGSDYRDDLLARLHSVDKLEDLTLIDYRAEGTVYKAHTAGNALIVVDLRSALLVGLDSVHTAGGGAGALHFIDSTVGTDSRAASALYALRLIYYRFAVNYLDSFLGTDFLTRVSKAALAAVGNVVVGFGTSVAGKLDDIYQRRIVVFFQR